MDSDYKERFFFLCFFHQATTRRRMSVTLSTPFQF